MSNFNMIITAVTKDLIAKLKVNRDLHKVQFKESIEAWRKLCIRRLERKLDKFAKARTTEQSSELSLVDSLIELHRPDEYTGDYNDAIEMLEMHQSDTIDLDRKTFQKFAQNKWDWIRSFEQTHQAYSTQLG